MNSRLFAAPGLLVLLALTACQNNSSRNLPGGGTGDAPMTASGELATTDPKPMDAQATFFGTQIGVEAMLAKSDAVWKNTPGDNGDGSGHGSGSGGLFGGGGGRRGRRGSGGDAPTPGSSDNTVARTVSTARPTNAPPIQLRLRLTNHGDQPVDIEVLDFNSELGNFAVQPPKITLAAGATVEADPMTSRLGVPAVEDIPITVRMRIGGAHGKVETQVMKLQPRVDPPAPVPATPAK